MEEQEGAVNFKFGVLYAKSGQRTDDEMFSNGEETGPYVVIVICSIGSLFGYLLITTVCCLNF